MIGAVDGDPGLLYPQIASVRAQLFARVTGYPNGRTTVLGTFSYFDARGVPPGYTVFVRIFAVVAKAGGKGTRYVALTPLGSVPSDFGQAGNDVPVTIKLGPGEHILAVQGDISVVPNDGGAPLFTPELSPVAEFIAYPG